MTDQELLLETARLFETATWIKGAYWDRRPRQDGDRVTLTGDSRPPADAICFCLFGGLDKVAGGIYESALAQQYSEAVTALAKVAGVWEPNLSDCGIARLQCWNDEPERTKGDIINALNRAAEMLA
jgi:hypothetical protein